MAAYPGAPRTVRTPYACQPRACRTYRAPCAVVPPRRCPTWSGLVCGAPQALPNLASRGSPMAYVFNYMGANPAHASIVKGAWPEGGAEG